MRPAWLMLLLLLLGSYPGSAQGRPTVGQVSHYEAKEGEDLLDIASRFNLAIDHLCFANGWPTEATDIYAGTPVTIPGLRVLPANPPRNGIVINIPERILFEFEEGHLRATYPISVGHPSKSPTPITTCRVTEKVKDPVWYPPAWAHKSGPVGPGPDNPLGNRWIGLSVGRYGIHSTYTPVNVGNDVTFGCIRMYPQSILNLFPRVQVGWPVRIEYEVAKLGKGAEGQPVLVTFPDTYKRSNPVESSRKLVMQNGYVWDPQVAKAAQQTSGLPIPLRTAKEQQN